MFFSFSSFRFQSQSWNFTEFTVVVFFYSKYMFFFLQSTLILKIHVTNPIFDHNSYWFCSYCKTKIKNVSEFEFNIVHFFGWTDEFNLTCCNCVEMQFAFRWLKNTAYRRTQLRIYAYNKWYCKVMGEGYCFHWQKPIITTHSRELTYNEVSHTQKKREKKNNVIVITLINKKKSNNKCPNLYTFDVISRYIQRHRHTHRNPFMFLRSVVFFQLKIVELAK